jgi:hypothetical protein
MVAAPAFWGRLRPCFFIWRGRAASAAPPDSASNDAAQNHMPHSPHNHTALLRRIAPLLLAAGLLLLFLLVFAAPCRAAEDDMRPSVSVESQYTGNARLSGDRGSVAFSTERVTASMLPLTLEYDVSDYSWRNISRLPFGDKRSKPWSTLQMLSATFDYARDVAGGLGFFTKATVFAG